MSVSRKLPPDAKAAIPLRVDHVTDNEGASTSILYCTDIEGTNVRVVCPEPSAGALPLDRDVWYRFSGVVRLSSPDADLLLPPEDVAAERIDPPARQAHPPLAELTDPWLVQLGASEDHVAVTVTPRLTGPGPDIRAGDPETFEIGAVCFARCDGSGETTVYHREESSPRDEHLLLEHVVEDLSEAARATLVTRGGSHDALELLYRRLALAAGGDIVATDAEHVLAECFHADAERVAVRAGVDTLTEAVANLDIETNRVSLSNYDIGPDPADWRTNWESDPVGLSGVSDPQMTDRDYATLVEWYLDAENESVDSAQLANCLKDYASADLRLLCALVANGTMDQLGCRRLSDRRFDQGQSH